MTRITRKPLRLAVVVAAAVALATGCSDQGMLDPGVQPIDAARGGVKIQAFAPADVIVGGSDNGGFVSFLANNSGRVTTEFWDNNSADNTGAITACNVGFFAAGTLATGCMNEAAGSSANKGGYSEYWAAASDDRAPAAFMFNGAYAYRVKLLGTFYARPSTVGIFTNDGGYTFTPLSLAIGGTTMVNTGGKDFGFFIANNDGRLEAGDGCYDSATLFYYCSDAIGGFLGAAYQQHALFRNADGSKFLVGMENNQLEVLPNASYRDSDYNDHIFEIVPSFTPGRMTGGGRNIEIGSVTLGLTLHCDIVLSNNLEVNWKDNKWHLDKPIDSALCTSSGDPRPPVAPFDTFEGVAYGKLNGVAGSRIEFTLIDAGEPGTNDRVRLKIFAPDNSVALDLPLSKIGGGNIQAHYDQPHGSKP